MRKILNIVLIVGMILLSVFLVSAQETNPWSAGSSGQEKNTFTTLDDDVKNILRQCNGNHYNVI